MEEFLWIVNGYKAELKNIVSIGLLKQILPESEFPVLSYPFAKESLMSRNGINERENDTAIFVS